MVNHYYLRDICSMGRISTTNCTKCYGEGEIEEEYTYKEKCSKCNGTKQVDEEYQQTCKKCKGRGNTFCDYYQSSKGGYQKCDRGTMYYYEKGIEWFGNPNPGYYLDGTATCFNCRGTSYAECSKCKGYGKAMLIRKITDPHCNGTGYVDAIRTKNVYDDFCEGTGKVSNFLKLLDSFKN